MYLLQMFILDILYICEIGLIASRFKISVHLCWIIFACAQPILLAWTDPQAMFVVDELLLLIH